MQQRISRRLKYFKAEETSRIWFLATSKQQRRGQDKQQQALFRAAKSLKRI
jgi:hypothetical protein